MSTSSEIKYFIKCDGVHYYIRIKGRCFGRYRVTIRGAGASSAISNPVVIYNYANEATVMRALRVFGALNDPAVSLMFPHWRVEE